MRPAQMASAGVTIFGQCEAMRVRHAERRLQTGRWPWNISKPDCNVVCGVVKDRVRMGPKAPKWMENCPTEYSCKPCGLIENRYWKHVGVQNRNFQGAGMPPTATSKTDPDVWGYVILALVLVGIIAA